MIDEDQLVKMEAAKALLPPPGDEVSAEAERVLKAASDRYGFEVVTEWFDWGCDRHLTTGSMMPPSPCSAAHFTSATAAATSQSAGTMATPIRRVGAPRTRQPARRQTAGLPTPTCPGR